MKNFVRSFLVLSLTLFYSTLKADMISLIRADQCETIVEVWIEEDRIRLSLEIGRNDYSYFSYAVPAELFQSGFIEQNRTESLKKFMDTQFVIYADKKKLIGSIKRMEEIPRNYRASLYTDKVDTVGSRISNTTLLVEIEYALISIPRQVSILPPIPEGRRNTPASIGFVCYHKELPVNDLRYLGQKETVNLDWADPWYSKFTNRNIARHHKSSLMSFLYVEPYEIRHEVLVRVKDLEDWIDLNYGIDDIILKEEQDSLKKYISQYLIGRNKVIIDGEEIKPILDNNHFVTVALSGIQILEVPQDLAYSSAIIGVIFAYPHDSIPKEVVVKWDMWSPKIQQVPCVMSDPAGPLPYDLSPNDSELVWTNFLKNYKIPTVSSLEVNRANFNFPYLSLFTLIVIILLLLSLRNAKRRTGKIIFIGISIVGGILLFPIQYTVEVPFLSKTSFTKPESKELIQGLLKNTYRSFDFRNEEDVYDRLALSVQGDLLSEIFIQMRKAIQLQNQGGIKVKLKDIEVLDVKELDSNNETLNFQCQWVVEGNVGHWGHIHRRINKYRAKIGIEPQNKVWKLKSIMIEEELRIF